MLDVNIKKTSGSYYTKPEIVSLMLDLVGYDTTEKLYNKQLLEPSAGDGAFLIPAIERLILSAIDDFEGFLFKDETVAFELLRNAICAIELNNDTYTILTEKVTFLLMQYGASKKLSEKLVEQWIKQTDFLFWNRPAVRKFDFIIGNPPYIRIENLNIDVSKKYRQMYKTLFDRADIYVAFIEHGLEMLAEEGKLTFICTDRFTKNRYGQKIRSCISDNYFVVNYLDIHNAQPFVDEVSAYPCIFTLKNGTECESRTLKMDDICGENLKIARDYLFNGMEASSSSVTTYTINKWFSGSSPWILNGSRAKEILEKLENSHPLLTDSPHCIEVGIGVATGAKEVYIINPEETLIESEVLLPVVTKDDIQKGFVDWRGKFLINPFLEDGSLVDLEKFPLLKSYFYKHEELLKKRNTAKKNPNKWYKTIDRIYPERLATPKLLIPDIKSRNLIVYEEGKFYPEHSLYYLTAGTWDIKALQALLTSSIVKFFIWSYATKMRGDYLRYQAQYLKKIRLPLGIEQSDIKLLKELYRNGDFEGIEQIAQQLFKLTKEELQDIRDLVEQ